MVNAEPILDTSEADEPFIDLLDESADDAPAGPDVAFAALALEPLSLDLGDLLPDAAGEVVLMGGADLPLSIHAGEAVTASGIADAHITAGGMDVTGLHFYSFASGITLYSPTDLAIDSPHATG